MTNRDTSPYLRSVLIEAHELAKKNDTGEPATYIPELANAPIDKSGIAITLLDGTTLSAGNCDDYFFTLQSVAKVALLIGLLEEYGRESVFSWINVEPSGRSFSAIDYGNRFSDLPSNPMINAGAIALCSYIPGSKKKEQLDWLDKWMQRLFNAELRINHKVYTSELENSDKNRSLSYLMRSNKVINCDIENLLKVYTALCSFEATILQASQLSLLLANGGLSPSGERVLTEETVSSVIPIMATCGLYNESGGYLVHTGMPAKSGVSGIIIASAIGHAGIAVFSPKLTTRGSSVRGQIMLEYLSKKLGWHFALK